MSCTNLSNTAIIRTLLNTDAEDALHKFTLDELLKEKGHSAYWLARQTGLTETQLYRIRHNKTAAIMLDTIDRICDALDCEVGDLVQRAPAKKKRRK